MRVTRWVLLIWIATLLVGPGRGVGAGAPALADEGADSGAGDDRRPVVVGMGNQVSGRLDVLWLGAPDAPFAAAMGRVAAMAAPRGLTVALTVRGRLAGAGADAPLVAAAWPCAEADTADLAAYARRGRGLLVLVGDVAGVRPHLSDLVEVPADDAARELDPSARAGLGGVVTFRKEPLGPSHVAVVPSSANPDVVALAAVRHAILRGGAVRHLPTVFASITAQDDGASVTVSAPTLLAGTVTMDAVTIEGVQVVPPGPALSIPAAAITDAEGTVLRLHFAGGGVTDDRRVRLSDVVGQAIDSACVRGLRRSWAGAPAAFCVVATTRDGGPASACAIDASLGETTAAGVTDDGGVAVLRFPAAPAGAKPRELVVNLTSRWGSRTLRATPAVIVRPTFALQTDRPIYRPGGLVKGRAIAFAADGRPAAGVGVFLSIRDARGRVIRSLSVPTDDFGAATFELPLSQSADRGIWDVTATAALAAGARTSDPSDPEPMRATFRVEDLDPSPFEVVVELDAIEVPRGGRIRGTIRVREWDGTGIGAFAANVRAGSEATAEVEGFGSAAFDLPAPQFGDRSGMVEIAAAARRGGEVSEARARARIASRPTPDPVVRVETAAEVAAGGRLAVTVRSSKEGECVDVVLAGRGRLHAAAAAHVRGGLARVELDVPPDATGPASVTAGARGADGSWIATAGCVTTISSLAVELAAPAAAAPGDDVTAEVRVRDHRGHDVPALLDVRVIDAATAAEVGGDALDPSSALGAESVRPVVLADAPSDGGRAEDGFLARAAAAAEPVVARAADGAAPAAQELPWGGRVFTGDLDGAPVAIGTAPESLTNGLAAGTAPFSLTLPLRSPPTGTGPALLLPWTTAAGRTPTGDRESRWLLRHQRPDGSWDPQRWADLCRPAGSCDEPGPAGMHIAGTSLGLLALLGSGETHQSGSAKAEIRAALAWLRARQRTDGFVGDPSAPCAVLNHAFATIALVESWGMTGSRLLESAARRSVAALVAMQRADGGFSEVGAARGSVIAGTVAMMAVKSARMAEVDLPRDVTQRHLAWMEANADPVLRAPLLSDEEIAAYPFGRSHVPRTAAAAAYLLRVFAADARDAAPDSAALTDALLHDLVNWNSDTGGVGDPFSAWIATLAAFQARGDTWLRWSEALTRAVLDQMRLDGGCTEGSWSDCDGPAGRFLATAFHAMSVCVYYRYSRVVGMDGDGSAPRVRAWFPDAAFSDLTLRTDAAGRRGVPFRVPDQVTTWRLDVGAWDREGRYGRATSQMRATLPVVASVGLPRHVCRGDVVRVPVVVRSTLAEDVDCTVEVTRHDGLEMVEAPPPTVRVAAGAGTTVFAVVRVVGDRAAFGVSVSGGGRSDAVDVTADVVAWGSAVSAAARAAPGETVRVPVAGTEARALLRVYRSALGAAHTAVEGLLRRPTGCFEQTCATLHPAVLAGRWIGLAESDPRAAYLRDGAQMLLSFEAVGGGFSLFRGQAARADLTALGIHVLLDLEPFAPADRGVLDRAGDFVAAELPADGPQRILALGALRRLGRAELPPLPDLHGDPYLVALALTQDLIPGPAALDAVAALAAAADSRVVGTAAWHSSSEALFSGVGVSSVETTAVVVEALARSGGHAARVRGGLETLRRALGGDGAWRTTRETVAALRALLAARPAAATGRVTADLAGRESVVAELGADVVDVDLGPWSAADAMTLRHDGTGDVWGLLIVRGGQFGASESRDPAVSLAVAWPKGPIRVGEPVALAVSISGATGRDVASPMVILPLPAGVHVDPRALLSAARAAGFADAECAGGAVRLYANRLVRGGALGVVVPCVARTAGTFTAGVATAYPYYEPDRESAAAAQTVEITGR